MKLAALTHDMVERAVSIYQDLAYGDGGPRRRAARDPDVPADGPLGRFHRERAERVPGHACRRFSMRLGNRNYPNMKLLLQEHLVEGEFFFAVDTHDQMEFGPELPDFEQWQALRRFNGDLKRRIEERFAQAGLDTAAVVRRQLTKGPCRDGAPCRGLALVVDDEEELADAVAQLLQRAGFRTAKVHDGRAALAAARELQPDLLLIDYELPELDGLQVIEALRADPATRELSVLLNSAAQVSLAEIRRADGFLSKPFTDGLLYSMIDRVLEKQTSVRTPR